MVLNKKINISSQPPLSCIDVNVLEASAIPAENQVFE